MPQVSMQGRCDDDVPTNIASVHLVMGYPNARAGVNSDEKKVPLEQLEEPKFRPQSLIATSGVPILVGCVTYDADIRPEKNDFLIRYYNQLSVIYQSQMQQNNNKNIEMCSIFKMSYF